MLLKQSVPKTNDKSILSALDSTEKKSQSKILKVIDDKGQSMIQHKHTEVKFTLKCLKK